MNTKKIGNKRYSFLLLCFFIFSTATFAQKNVIGLIGNSGELVGVELFPVTYIDGLRISREDVEPRNFNISSLYEMHQLNYRELGNVVNGSLRFDGNKIYVSTLGSPEYLINITVHKNFNEKTGEDGTATLYFEGGDSLDIEFSNIINDNINVWILRFFVPETTEHEVEYDNGFEFTKEKGKEAENQPINGFNVSVHYLIK